MAAAGKGMKRKRRPKDVCPNPLFLKWLEEWRDEANENGWKTSYTYNKVIYSLKRYPLPIYSGQEAKVLEYVGDKVAKKLDEKISEFLANGGTIADLHSNTDVQAPPTKRQQSGSSMRTSVPHTGTPSPQARTKTQTQTHTPKTQPESATRKRTNDEDTSPSAPPPSKRSKSTKEYVPRYRSGPYALLVALIKAEQDKEYSKGFMYKNELIDAAQEHCDSSFTVPDDPNSYYTAWSSMANLIKKGLVERSSQPAKFSLTEAGASLSLRLLQRSTDGGLTNSQDDITSSSSQSHDRHADNSDNHMTITCSQSSTRSLSDSYSPYKESPVKPRPPAKEESVTILDSDDDEVVEIPPLAQRLGLKKYSQTQTQCSQSQPKHSRAQCEQSQTQREQSQTQPVRGKQTLSSTGAAITSSTIASTAQKDEILVDFSSPLFTLRPGQFEVVLCVDNSESSANRKSKSNFRGLLLEELTKNGVKFSVRNLNVGDFLWIAKEIVHAVPDQLRLPESREIVLEYIIERKRMDDLSDSIIDRRFHEQKFRMKLCGVTNPVYLVEEYGDIAHCKVSQKGLHQAITNTQVMDSFFIKQTKDIKGSISYLTIMTRQLQKKYTNKTIKAFPVESMQQLQKQHQKPSEPSAVYGMPFNKFNEASVKSKVSTASEMFARQLIQVPGSSADKAHSVIQLYPTMSDLYDAYSKCSDEKERESLLSSIRFGASKRKIGNALSKTLYSLYWRGE